MTYQGLSSAQVASQLKKFGHNTIEYRHGSVWKLIADQFLSPLIVLLIIASLISFLLGNNIDAVIILSIILLNAGIGFLQEYRANTEFKKLQSFIKSEVRVLRDGKYKFVKKDLLVPGDIVYLHLGDIVPADCYVLEAENLLLDESAISGESKPVSKVTNTIKDKGMVDGVLFSGSSIVSGTVTAEIFATGSASNFGKIATLALNTEKVSEYEQNIKDLSKKFMALSIVALVFIFTSHLLLHRQSDLLSILLFTIAISITIIPEALPVVARLTLYKSAISLGKKGVIIKRLAAIEDLGNIDLICTDKTGTLTKNELTVFDIHHLDNDAEFMQMLAYSSTQSNDPLDIAIQKFLNQEHATKADNADFEELPFDPVKKYSGRKFKDFTIIKGAPEAILALTDYKEDHKSEKSPKDPNLIARKIAFALVQGKKHRYLGSLFLHDEIRPETNELIAHTRTLGVEVKLISGDSIEVSQSVALTVGLIKSENEAILAEKLSFDSPEKFAQEVEQYHVFARCNPEQKYQIIQALQKSHFVGYIGDGINDTPSLNLANVSLVVKNASDIAKSSADMILLSRSLNVIIEAIVDGRKCFENIDKFLLQTLTGNVGNFLTIGLISLFINYLPMLPIQILISNLLSDIASLTISTDNVDKSELRTPASHDNSTMLRIGIWFGILSMLFDFLFFYFIATLPVGTIQTAWFAFSTISEIFVLLSLRSKFSIFSKRYTRPSRSLLVSIVFATGISLLLVVVGSELLSIQKLDTGLIGFILLLSLIYFGVNEVFKRIVYSLSKKS
jgi:Mg2+-importing ATPase